MGLANPSNNYTNNRFVVSVHSSGLNLSRGGTLRLNLNQVVTSSTDATTIRSQSDRILAGITNANTNAAPSNTAAMPAFGQRFYRTDESSTGLNGLTVSGQSAGSPYPALYLQRVAANIRDYIDTDSIPTVVDNTPTFPVRPSNNINPWNAAQGNGPFENEVAAVGKEPVPLLSEAAVVLRYIAAPGNNFTFNLAFYFEFWNSTTNSISLSDLGNPTLTIGNLYDFQVVGGGSMDPAALAGGQSKPRPVTRIDLPLSGFTGLTSFPPNSFTVLTTDSGAWPFTYPTAARLYVNPAGYLTYSGTRTSANNRVRATFGSPRAGTTSTDYDLWMWLAGSQGTIESFTGIVTAVGGGSHALEFTGTSTNIIRVSSLVGNSTASITARTGDPRSINEPIQLSKYLGGGSLDRYSFANASQVNTDSSLGFFTNTSGFMTPNNWPDYVTNQPTSPADPAAISPYRHVNGNLDSIARLGDVYDPARRAVDGTTPQRAIGGGRTFKIGQAERRDAVLNPAGLWDGTETSASRNWTSWRLADVFSTTNATNLPGLININGALRDTNALSALVFGLTFESSPGGAQATSGRNLNAANFVTAVRNHLAGGTIDTDPSNDRLFWERGQLGEIADSQNRPLLSSPLNTLAGVALSTTQDRGREELVRRMMELITTKGNVYTIYAVGQSLNPRTGQPVATQKMKRTFRIDPTFNPALPADNTFDPAQAGTGSATDRFRRPSGFTVTVLQSSVE